MSPFKSLPAAIVGLVALVMLAFFIGWLVNGDEPGAATVKALVTKEMTKRFQGCVIKSITIVRGGMFPCQGHRGIAAYGTLIYPTLVKVIYTMPSADDGGNETREFNRTFFLYRNASHQWARDTDLN